MKMKFEDISGHGDELERRGDFAAALAHWSQISETRPDFFWQALLRKAQTLELLEEWDRARSTYAKAMKAAPSKQASRIEGISNSLRERQESLSYARKGLSSLEFCSLSETKNALVDAIRERRPFSLIRLGDGEGTVLGFPQLFSKDALHAQLRIWLPSTQIDKIGDDHLANQIHQLIVSSTASADVLGLPGYRRLQSANQAKAKTLPGKFSAPQKNRDRVACAAIYSVLGMRRLKNHKLISSEFATRDIYAQEGFSFLNNLGFLGVISSHALGPEISKKFGIESVSQYLVPRERPDSGTQSETALHYPDIFSEICEKLEVPYRGAVFIVGAGVLGKHYCELVKKRGGIAIDVGSLLDGWARSGRSHIAANAKFHL